MQQNPKELPQNSGNVCLHFFFIIKNGTFDNILMLNYIKYLSRYIAVFHHIIDEREDTIIFFSLL